MALTTEQIAAKTEELKAFISGLIDWAAHTGVSIVLKVIAALVIMFISFKIINRIARKINTFPDIF